MSCLILSFCQLIFRCLPLNNLKLQLSVSQLVIHSFRIIIVLAMFPDILHWADRVFVQNTFLNKFIYIVLWIERHHLYKLRLVLFNSTAQSKRPKYLFCALVTVHKFPRHDLFSLYNKLLPWINRYQISAYGIKSAVLKPGILKYKPFFWIVRLIDILNAYTNHKELLFQRCPEFHRNIGSNLSLTDKSALSLALGVTAHIGYYISVPILRCLVKLCVTCKHICHSI